ncbi:carbohydrate ABC transporter permease [Propionicicella superfundia]|uniref:carbohydrate ABC transporter permease n=1 Tax=Propionicicella superfundia TaxID=348582 RepID=UPI000406D4D1|nr:carbohydrate ABC transporter permease [Propionicicella superfundia]
MTTAVIPAPAKKDDSKDKRRGRAGWLIETIVVLLCVAWTIPTLSLVITSFRPPELADNSGWWTWFANPLQLTLDNYQGVLDNASNPMGTAFVNSLAIAVPSTIIPILIAAFAAYAFTFMEFRGRDVLFIIVVGLLVVPNQVALVPLSVLFEQWGLQGQFVTAWLAHAGFGMPLAVYILRNYMATLPKAVTESAKIDGASHFQIFWRLIVPMSWPALASFAIFQFLWVWNDLLVALIFIGPGENQPMTIALASLLGTRGVGWQLLTAGACLTMLVPLIVFLSLQRFFIRGLTAGAVKG